MNWYPTVRYLHIIAVAIPTGRMYARQLACGMAKKSDDVKAITTLTQIAHRMDHMMVIPWSKKPSSSLASSWQ